jgi:hypothetical protein
MIKIICAILGFIERCDISFNLDRAIVSEDNLFDSNLSFLAPDAMAVRISATNVAFDAQHRLIHGFFSCFGNIHIRLKFDHLKAGRLLKTTV